MNLGMLTLDQVDNLCKNYVVELFDRAEFRPLGVPLARWNLGRMDALRAHMKAEGCDKPVNTNHAVRKHKCHRARRRQQRRAFGHVGAEAGQRAPEHSADGQPVDGHRDQQRSQAIGNQNPQQHRAHAQR